MLGSPLRMLQCGECKKGKKAVRQLQDSNGNLELEY